MLLFTSPLADGAGAESIGDLSCFHSAARTMFCKSSTGVWACLLSVAVLDLTASPGFPNLLPES